ncbi:parathymosin-like, partial [Micropterus salmoides]|uniref:parathymosin-like n=1 Tax=Micropterus salmoides TaxID=27706 RepID=UPI0018ED84CE
SSVFYSCFFSDSNFFPLVCFHQDLKEKKLVEEKENGKDAATNGKENEGNGEPEVDDEDDEEVDEEDEEMMEKVTRKTRRTTRMRLRAAQNGRLKMTTTTKRTTSKPRSRKPTMTIDAFSPLAPSC